MIRANTLQWSEGVYETSERDITGFTTHTYEGITTLLKIGDRFEGQIVLFEISKHNGKYIVISSGPYLEETEKSVDTLDEALDQIDLWNNNQAEIKLLGYAKTN